MNAEVLESQEKWEDAAKEYRAILGKNLRLPGIHYRLGRLILSAPKKATTLEDAKREFEEELKINPWDAAAEYVSEELAFQSTELEKAITHLSRAIQLDAGFADAYLELGRALMSAERITEAVGPLETAVKLQPEDPLTHFHLSAAYTRLGRNEEAKRERGLHKELSEKMRQAREDVQRAVGSSSDGIHEVACTPNRLLITCHACEPSGMFPYRDLVKDMMRNIGDAQWNSAFNFDFQQNLVIGGQFRICRISGSVHTF